MSIGRVMAALHMAAERSSDIESFWMMPSFGKSDVKPDGFSITQTGDELLRIVSLDAKSMYKNILTGIVSGNETISLCLTLYHLT